MPLVRVLDAATGEAVEVDDSEASSGLAAGRYQVGGGPVRLRLADGGVAEVAPENVANALRDSATFVGLDTPEYAAERERRRTYGDRPIAAGTLGAARGATLGLSDVAGAGLGFEEDIAGLRELNPEASIGGEIAGSVAPVLFSGGLGAAGAGARTLGTGARVARTLTAPVRGLAALSEGAGAATARAIIGGSEAGIGSRVAARVFGTGVEGAIEGVGGEAASMLSEQALGTGDPDLTAQQVVARLGFGALMGGSAGALLGGGGAGVSEALRGGGRLGRDAVDVIRRSWRERVGTEIDDTVAEALAEQAGRQVPATPGRVDLQLQLETPQDVVRALGTPGPAQRRVMEILERGDEVYETGTRTIRSDLGELLTRSTHVEDFARGSLKRQAIRSRIEGTNVNDQFGLAVGTLDRARAVAARLQTDSIFDRAGIARGRELAAYVDTISADIENAITQANPTDVAADLYIRLDQMKRRIGQMQRTVGHRDQEAARALQELYDSMITPLEDPHLWGEPVAAAQRDLNSAWHRYLGRGRTWNDMFTAEGAPDDLVNPWRILREPDPAKIDPFLRATGRAANDRRSEIFREVLESRQQLAEMIAKHMDVPPELAAAVRESPALIKRVRETLEEAERTAKIANQWAEASAELAPSRGIMGAISGTIYAGTAGGVVGAVGPSQTLRVLSAVQRIARSASEDIGVSVRKFLGTARRAGRTAARRTRRAAVLGTVKAYEARIRELDEQTKDQAATAQRMADSTRELTRDAPSVQQALQVTGGRALGILNAARPSGRIAPGSLWTTPADAQPSRDEMERFLRVARVVDDPMTVVRDLEDRSLEGESVDTLRAAYPALYNEIVRQAYEAIAEAPTEPPYQDRIQLGVLLGIPTDPSLVPENLAILQAAHIAASTPTQTSTASSQQAPDLAGQLASPTQRLEARR